MSLALVFYFARQKLSTRHVFFALAITALSFLPTLIYNEVRMGSPLRPATTAPQFDAANGLTGNIAHGFLGLFFSPNRGLFVFAPIFLLLFAIPIFWKRFPSPHRQFVLAYVPTGFLYALLIGKIVNWGAFGWGPRYLLPILPILFVAISAVLIQAHKRYRPALMLLVLLSAAINIAPLTVNWHLIAANDPRNIATSTAYPRQILETWNGLGLLARGKTLPAPPQVLQDPIRNASARLPDFWTVYLMDHSKTGLLAGLLITIILLTGCVWSFLRLIRVPV